MSLSEEEVIELYGKRWDIEVFFKICKSYLKLSREFQGLSYDLMTAHTAVVMTRYIILAANKRQNEDARSIGELFFLMHDEISDMRFADVLTKILAMLHNMLNEDPTLSNEQIDKIINIFISILSRYFNDSLVSDRACA